MSSRGTKYSCNMLPVIYIDCECFKGDMLSCVKGSLSASIPLSKKFSSAASTDFKQKTLNKL